MSSSSTDIYLNLPVIAVAEGGPACKKFHSIEERVSSYDSSLRDKFPPFVTMAKAGFFATGVNDITMCYYCALCLKSWNSHDSPWLEHQVYSPGCAHLILHKRESGDNVSSLLC